MTRFLRRAVAVAGATTLVIGLTLVMTAASVGAATFTVTNTNDAGPGSLRQALLDAALAATDSTITVSDDLDDETIFLTSGQLLYDPPGNLASLTIEGNGVTVRQTGAARVLFLRTAGRVVLEEITITGGRSPTTGGGLANAFFSELKIVDSVFRDNQSNNDGGAIFVGEPVTIERSRFTNNRVVKVTGTSESAGGTIAVVAAADELALVLEESTVTENSIQGGTLDPDVGGAGVAAGGTIRIERSTIAENTVRAAGNPAVVAGGGVFAFSSVSVETSTITENSIQGPGSAGGGVGIVTIPPELIPRIELIYSDVVDNSASRGGNLAIVDATALDTEAAAAGGDAAAVGDGLDVRKDNVGVTEDGPVPLASEPKLDAFASVITEPGGDSDNCFGFEETDSAGWNFADDDSCDLDEDTDSQRDDNDPLLGDLADNGGPTETLLPAVDSPLVNAIPSGDCEGDDDDEIDVDGEDQRGSATGP